MEVIREEAKLGVRSGGRGRVGLGSGGPGYLEGDCAGESGKGAGGGGRLRRGVEITAEMTSKKKNRRNIN